MWTLRAAAQGDGWIDLLEAAWPALAPVAGASPYLSGLMRRRPAHLRRLLEADPDAPPTMTYDVWLDEDDLIRKMSFTQGGADAVLTASEWGEPVSITKPKSSELAEVP